MKQAFEGKVAIVTGGASGIGEALARELALQGTRVVLADRQLERARAIATDIESKGGKAEGTALDVRDAAAVDALVEDVVRRHGKLDFLFNNAGITVGGDLLDYELRDFDEVFDVNLRGVAYGIRAAYPRMTKQGFGHIVNTASIAGLVPLPGNASYTASKHAVVGLSKVLRVEARRHGVHVSVLCPGFISTPILTGGEFGRSGLPADISKDAIKARWERAPIMSPQVFAQKALARIAKREAIIVVPRMYKLLWLIERFSPALSMGLASKFHRKVNEDLEAMRRELQAGPAPKP